MEAWTIVGVIASIIAALGVMIELGLGVWNRPRAGVEFQHAEAADLTEHLVIVRNVGPFSVRGMWFAGVNCRVVKRSPSLEVGSLDDGEHGSVTPARVSDDSFILVGLNHP